MPINQHLSSQNYLNNVIKLFTLQYKVINAINLVLTSKNYHSYGERLPLWLLNNEVITVALINTACEQ